jgi:hypothetical protein
MLSKISRLGCRLKFSNSESGCEVAAVHLLNKLRPQIGSCRSADGSTCAFQLFIPFLASVSLLEIKRPFRKVTPRADS